VGQPTQPLVERRRDPRRPKAFSLWLRPRGSYQRISAWMLDVSAGGAALLTPADRVPPLGVRVELSEMHTTDPLVRAGAGPLPRFARVIRHDGGGGLTRRMAVQFEAQAEDGLVGHSRQVALASQPRAQTLPMPPPVAASNSGIVLPV
jgi:hypothetical protein